MSTALAVIDVNDATILEPGSALELLSKGKLSLADLDDSFFAGEDEDDLHGVHNTVPRIIASGKHGRFLDPGTKATDAKNFPDEITGIILARAEGNVFFVPQPKSDAIELAEKSGYRALIAGGDDKAPKWICKCANTARPLEASLNPQLTTLQAEEARKIGIGGATGKGCSGCPAGQWVKTETGTETHNQRLCSQVESLVWVDSKNPEPKVLQVTAGNSVANLKKFFSSNFKRAGRALSLFVYFVKLSWDSKVVGKNEVQFVKADIVGSWPPDMMQSLREQRKGCLWMLESAAKVVDDAHHAEATSEVEPAASVVEGQLMDSDAPDGGVLGGLL